MTHAPKPPWLKVQMPGSPRYHQLKKRARGLALSTVCEQARCPNIGECWAGGTATFMVMGDICTRGCRFCAVSTRKHGLPLDPDEPAHLATAIAELQLEHVVVTSVDRDDLPDHGAAHFAACVQAIRQAAPRTTIEVLIPDFGGVAERLSVLVDSAPDVVAHNLETVPRLTPTVRDPRASYAQSLQLLAEVKQRDPARLTKSSLMLGLGEREPELRATMIDLRAVGVDFLTLGQYLQPSRKHLAVAEYVTPASFADYEALGLELGFRYVASGPLVRSSYKAAEYFIHRQVRSTP